MTDLTFSRRKMFWKVRVTEVVPAPEEPVIAIMGWRSDMIGSLKLLNSNRRTKQAALIEQRIGHIDRLRRIVILFDPFHFIARAEDQADALVQGFKLDFHDRMTSSAGPPTGLLHDESNRVGFIQ